MITRTEIENQVKSMNGKARYRIITQADIDIMLDEIQSAAEGIHTIRVYPAYGFVPNSYKYRADGVCLIATRQDGDWAVKAASYDAKRPYGSGPRVTHNGR